MKDCSPGHFPLSEKMLSSTIMVILKRNTYSGVSTAVGQSARKVPWEVCWPLLLVSAEHPPSTKAKETKPQTFCISLVQALHCFEFMVGKDIHVKI